jgi:hypothetical protein
MDYRVRTAHTHPALTNGNHGLTVGIKPHAGTAPVRCLIPTGPKREKLAAARVSRLSPCKSRNGISSTNRFERLVSADNRSHPRDLYSRAPSPSDQIALLIVVGLFSAASFAIASGPLSKRLMQSAGASCARVPSAAFAAIFVLMQATQDQNPIPLDGR